MGRRKWRHAVRGAVIRIFSLTSSSLDNVKIHNNVAHGLYVYVRAFIIAIRAEKIAFFFREYRLFKISNRCKLAAAAASFSLL